jgi:DNA repair protein RecN (Recombination protein N)
MNSLVTLSVENFVLIKKAQIELAAGLNIISGQTGAGKSLLLRALMFILGDRFNASDVLNKERNKTHVEAHFVIEGQKLRADLRTMGLPEDWDGEELILARSMDTSGRSRVRIGGRMATLTQLKKIARRLVSVLSQQAYQRLVKDELQNQVLDHFGQHLHSFQQFSKVRQEAAEVLNELQELTEFQKRQQLYQQRCREDFNILDQLKPKNEEFSELSAELDSLKRAEELRNTLLSVIDTLSESDRSLISVVRGAERRIDKLLDLLPTLGAALGALETARDEINEAVYEMARCERSIQDNPTRLHAIEERLSELKDAARRLRVPVEQLRSEYDRLAEVVGDDVSDRLKVLKQCLKPILEQVWRRDKELYQKRKSAANKLQKVMLRSLADLGMEKARFQIRLANPGKTEGRLALPPSSGSAQTQLFLAANPGDQLRPLKDVASGGELSRVMLALQRHLGKALDVALLVFDEVDQNVGGRLGPIIGRELAILGQERQILVISHLPQVAAFAEKHVLAEKFSSRQKTETRFKVVDGDERLRELAAMTRGPHITPTALNEAKELLEQARATIRQEVNPKHSSADISASPG